MLRERPVSRLQAAILRWDGNTRAWESENLNPNTLLELFRSAVLQLVDDDSYHARREAVTAVLDLFSLSSDMQVRRSTDDVARRVHCALYCAAAPALDRCLWPFSIRLAPRVRTCVAV